MKEMILINRIIGQIISDTRDFPLGVAPMQLRYGNKSINSLSNLIAAFSLWFIFIIHL